MVARCARSETTSRWQPWPASPFLQLKLKTFFVGSALSGLAGAVYAHLTGFIAPDGFVPLLTIYIFLAATAGGYTRLLGAVTGAVVVLVLLESTRFAAATIPGLGAVQVASLREFVIAVVLIAIMQLRPQGIFESKGESAPRPGDLLGVPKQPVTAPPSAAPTWAFVNAVPSRADWDILRARVAARVPYGLLTLLEVDWEAQLVRAGTRPTRSITRLEARRS